MTNKLRNLLDNLLSDLKLDYDLQHRTKTIESYLGKVGRKNYSDPIHEVKDLSGLRIIVNSLTDVELVAAMIKQEFHVDPAHSVDKMTQLAEDQFGYRSQHYVVKNNESRARQTEWSPESELWAEIQVRTRLQHIWATNDHLYRYKSGVDLPPSLRRRLYRLSALFELADSELANWIESIDAEVKKATSSVRKRDYAVPITLDSLKAFVPKSEELKKWRSVITGLGINMPEDQMNIMSRDIKLAQRLGIRTLGELEDLLSKAHGWGERFFSAYFERYAATLKTKPQGITMVSNGPITYILIASQSEKLSPQELSSEFGVGIPWVLNIAREARGLAHPKSKS